MSNEVRFALIDRYTGLIAWVGEASSPELACVVAAGEATPGQFPRGYERVAATSVDAGFDVYLVPAGSFTDVDSDDGNAIAAIRGCAFLGMYQSIAPADLSDVD